MSALKKAGVWLGLIEEEDDDRAYERNGHPESGYRDSGYRSGRESRVQPDDFADEDEDDEDLEEVPTVPRARGLERPAERIDPLRSDPLRSELGGERASVRSIARSTSSLSSSSAGSMGYATRDSLALSQQLQVRERSTVAEEDDRRYQITTLHPTTYREARTIGEHFRDGVPVIINLTEMEEQDARRLVDFAAGLAFGLRGTIERVTNRVFLLSPANVQVTAEDKAKIAEGGFFTSS